MKVTILGCGGSGGVPTASGMWGTCDPSNPRNQRLRPSILVNQGTTTLLVDTSPDLRTQLLRAGSPTIDAILFTHAHADHTHGFDEIRSLNLRQKCPIDIYGDAATMAEIKTRFAYVFKPRAADTFYKPAVHCHIIDPVDQARLRFGDIHVTAFVQDHGYSQTVGYRFNDFAYTTDAKSLDENAFAKLSGIKAWVVDAVREEPHPTHSHVAQTLEWIARVGPKRAWLTHMNQTLDYANLAAKLPPHVAPAHDGLVIDID